MDYKPRPWQLILLIALLCGAAVGGVVWYRSRTLTPAASLRRMPVEDTVVLWIDFAALRGDGLLQLLDGAKAGQDPEYQTFVRQTRFDYMHDLDSAMVAFAPTGNYFLVKGRFDWNSLRNYVEQVDGSCLNTLCRVNGSGPDRRISFFPVHRDLMAMASSPDGWAALRLSTARPGPDPPVPNAPVWLAFPGSLLKSNQNLPDGARPFARAMEGALSVTISFAPERDRLVARLDVRSNSDREAAAAAAQLTEATQLLSSLIARENLKPNPADPSGVLAAGTFHAEGTHVAGVWPIAREFIQNLLGSQ